MIFLVGTLALLLAAPSACELTDNACKARQFIAKAARAAPPQRARYLFTAHRSYLALFASTGQLQHLCAARTNFDRSLAITDQSDQQRASFENSRAELEALEQQHGARCPRPRKPAHKLAHAEPTPPEPTPPEPLLEPTTKRDPPAPAPPAPAVVLTAPRDPAVRPGQPLVPAPTVHPTRRRLPPGRPLAVAGGVTLGLGIIFTGTAAYTGSRAADVADQAYTNYQEQRGMGSPEGHAEQDGLRRDFDRWLGATVGTAVAGSTAVIVGAVLLHLGVRKLRDPTRLALIPTRGGLAIHARF